MNVFPKILLFIFLLTFCLSGMDLSADGKLRCVWNSGRRYIYLTDIASFYKLKLNYDGKKFVMSARNGKMVFTPNKRYGSINGTVVTYHFPVLFRRGIPYVSEADFSLHIEPVMRFRTNPRYKVRSVMIDAGHGGQDNGAPGVNSRWEKEATLSIAKKLRAELMRRGFSVTMTRMSDRFPTLENRMEVSRKVKPDLFISIHCNAAKQRNISGVETFAMTPAGAPSSSDSKPGFNKSPGNNFDKLNFKLAYEIQKSLVKETRASDRGVKHARFYVVKNVKCPAVLIETGFISNPGECSRIFSEKGQNAVTKAIVNGILRFAADVR